MNYLEIIGTLIGLVYLWLEYHANYWLWIAGLLMPLIYIFVYYDAGLYADMGISVYYVLASLYGFLYWVRRRARSVNGNLTETPIKRTPKKKIIPIVVVLILLNVVISQILIHYTDSKVPWIDGFTTALSIVAMWMLSRKYSEQWIAWIAVDVVSTILYVYKGLYFTSGLYALYAVIAYFGYMKWEKLRKDQLNRNKHTARASYRFHESS